MMEPFRAAPARTRARSASPRFPGRSNCKEKNVLPHYRSSLPILVVKLEGAFFFDTRGMRDPVGKKSLLCYAFVVAFYNQNSARRDNSDRQNRTQTFRNDYQLTNGDFLAFKRMRLPQEIER